MGVNGYTGVVLPGKHMVGSSPAVGGFRAAVVRNSTAGLATAIPDNPDAANFLTRFL